MEADEQAREQAREEVEFATALVSRIGEGDRAAETALVRRYQDRLRHVLLNQMANRDDVEDVLQNTFITVIVTLRERAIDDPGRLGGYIYGVAKNIRRAYVRDKAKHQHEPELEALLRDESPGPEQQASSTETTRIVRQLTSELGEERDRQVLNRLYVLEQDKQVICDELGIDRAHLRRVLHRAKRRLEVLFREAERARRLNLIPEE
jgi:RNA polymerase sigma-70 factor (ECF subfamily)